MIATKSYSSNDSYLESINETLSKIISIDVLKFISFKLIIFNFYKLLRVKLLNNFKFYQFFKLLN